MTGAERGSPEEPRLIVSHYERLRRAALGEVLPPEARSGLTLFLRRGMRGWVRAIATASASPQTTRAPSVNAAPPGDARAVIHILAALAIADHRGVRP
jgi:hypothetical protein